MANVRAARRYARAIFDIAVDHNDLDGWLRDLRAIRDRLGEPNVLLLLENPEVPAAEKHGLVAQLLGNMNTLRQNLVYVLIENRRVDTLDQIVAEFERMYNERNRIAVAKVTTAVPLDEDAARSVQAQLERLTEKRVILQPEVDPGILGGVVAQIGDRLINGSLAARLEALRAEMAR